jgi:hypothetical protein
MLLQICIRAIRSLYPSQVSGLFWNWSDPAEIRESFRALTVFGELIVTSSTLLNELVFCDNKLFAEDVILIEKIDTAREIKWDIYVLRYTRMAPEKAIGIKDYFEFRNVMRNTTPASLLAIYTSS